MELEPGASLSGSRVGPYLIAERIGAGGMGEVYRASDERLQRTVAIKSLPARLATETARARMAREARLTCRVTHPYIATVFDVVEQGDDLYLAMEYIKGRTLGRVLRDDRPDLATTVRYAREIAEALGAIHAAGIVHRDLKPGNVMIANDGHVKVMDFGLACRIVSSSDTEGTTLTDAAMLTQAGHAVGTPLYMSPEQMRGEQVDARSDLFAFGVLLYESIAGQHPFRRASPELSWAALLHEPPSCETEPDSLTSPGPLRDLVLGLLQKDRAKRIASVDEALERLREAESRQTAPANATTATRWLPALAVTGLVAVVLGTWWWLTLPPRWDEPRAIFAIAPFRNRTGLDDGALKASLVGEMLVADLSGSRLIRVIGPERTAVLTAGLPADTDAGVLVDRVAAGTAADYVLVGTLFHEEGELAARVDVVAAGAEFADPPSFRANAPTAMKLVERLGTLTRRGLPRVTRVNALRDGWVGVEDVLSSDDEALDRYQQAELALQQGRLHAAIEGYESAIAADPVFAKAHRALAKALYTAGYGRRSRSAAERAVEVSPDGDHPATERLALAIRMTRAEVYGRVEDLVTAAAALAARFPDDPQILTQHADALSLRGDHAAAEEVFDRAEESAPEDPWLALARAVARMRATDEAALELAARAEALFRNLDAGYYVAEAIYARGRAFSALQRLPEALEELERARDAVAAEDTVQAARFELEIARVEMLLGDPDSARERIELAAPTLRSAGRLGMLCRILSINGARSYAQGSYDEARTDLRDAVDLARQLESDERLLSPLSNLAGLLSHLGEIREARELFAETLPIAERLGRENSRILSSIYLADIEYQLGEMDAAIQAYRSVQEIETRTDLTRLSVWSYLGLAEILNRRGDLQGVLAEAEAALAIGRERELPDVTGYALVRRAGARADLGRFDEAARDLDEAESIATAAGRSLRELAARVEVARARLALRAGRDADALGHVDKAAALGALSVPAVASEAHRWACDALRNLGRRSDAIDRCRDAEALERAPLPERVESRARLAWTLARGSGDPAEAGRLAREALGSARDLRLNLSLARAAAALAATGDESALEEGAEAFQRYFEASPPEALDALAARPDLRELRAILGDPAGVWS